MKSKKNIFDNPLTKHFEKKFGDLPFDDMIAAMRKEGYGKVIDELLNNPGIQEEFMNEYGFEFYENYAEKNGPEISLNSRENDGRPADVVLAPDDYFDFDGSICLTNCDENAVESVNS